MYCRFCNYETSKKICPRCKNETSEEVPTAVYWCASCKIPVIKNENQADKTECPLCKGKLTYLSQDLRPVFPEERLLLELLLGKNPRELAEKSVWCENSRYFVDGEAISLSSDVFKNADTEKLSARLREESGKTKDDYKHFDIFIEKFVRANRIHLNEIIEESHSFIKKTASCFPSENIVLSFSGGKDSTVTADVVTKALSNPSLVHIFGNTTLEFPSTYDYVKRFRAEHPHAIFETAVNDEQVFSEVCEDIGPPARMMRWCCSMFKTGPITRVLNGLYRNQQILTFYGIRKVESVARSKYDRVTENTESVKIQKQTVASPIFFWKDIDIWLYLLAEKVDFNDAYRLGYDRVGCWCCPNNNQRAQFLSRIYMKERSEKWRDFLIGFARKIGKPDPEVYVDSGAWKARQGGNGLAAAGDVKIRFTNCTAEDNAKNYSLVRPFDDELVGMFAPFGKISRELGQKLLNEVIILDIKTNVPIISLQPFKVDGFEHAVKVKTMNVASHDYLQRQIGYQIRKFNACRKCLKCESVCKEGAIHISAAGYFIDPEKCVRCKKCVTEKYLTGGCMMEKYLRTKGN